MSSLFSDPEESQSFQHSRRGHGLRSPALRASRRRFPPRQALSRSPSISRQNGANVVFAGVPDIAAVIAAIGEAGYECMVENAA